MTKRLSYGGHARALLGLGLPLVGSNIAQGSIHITDTMMMGWYDAQALAAVVVASSLFMSVFIVGSGFAWAVTPLVAEAASQGDITRLRRITRMGLWATLGFCLLILPLLLLGERLFLALGQEPAIAALAGQYLSITGWAIIPALSTMLLRSYLAGMERTQIVFWMTIAASVVNAVLNWALIFGHWGMPELGARGAAISSLIMHCASLAILAAYAQRSFPEHQLFHRIWRPDWHELREVFRLGWPIGVASLAETALFSGSAIMIGWIGAVELAGHGIALQVATMTFVIHLGLSQAATVRVGQAMGRRDPVALRDGALVAIGLSLGVAAMGMAVMIGMPKLLVGLFIGAEDPARAQIIAVGSGLLILGAIFQATDAMQVMAISLLRGLQDTRIPMILATISYWVIGAPVAYILGFWVGFGAYGVWSGLVLGLAVAAATLLWRLWRRKIPQLSWT
ncbi:MAG: MATE family efflux transporter [Mangrovicoccus sp.]